MHWAHNRSFNRTGGEHLGLNSKHFLIKWFGKRGMKWEELIPKIEQNIASLPPPTILVIQLGSNDLGIKKSFELIDDIKTDLLRIMMLLPDTKIVWSDILMRRYWHNAVDGKSIEIARKRVNLEIKNFISEQNSHFVVHHPNIRAREKTLFRFDGTHLSDVGNDIYLNNIQGILDALVTE